MPAFVIGADGRVAATSQSNVDELPNDAVIEPQSAAGAQLPRNHPKLQNFLASPTGFERDEVAKSSGENAGYGPIGPQDGQDRAASHGHRGPQSDAVSIALRNGLEEALAAGRPEDAAQLAFALASRFGDLAADNVVRLAATMRRP